MPNHGVLGRVALGRSSWDQRRSRPDKLVVRSRNLVIAARCGRNSVIDDRVPSLSDRICVPPFVSDQIWRTQKRNQAVKARRTFSVMRDTLLSYELWERLPNQLIELTEKTAPPFWVSK